MLCNTLCPKFNGGNWLALEDDRGWGGNYWHQNTCEVLLVDAANHVELSDSLLELYWRMVPRGGAGEGEFRQPWPEFRERVPLHGGGVVRPPLVPRHGTHILSVGLEVSLQAWWRYEYTHDEKFLAERVYPLLKGSVEFYRGYARKGPDGKYHVEPSNAQETCWAVKDPHQDMAGLGDPRAGGQPQARRRRGAAAAMAGIFAEPGPSPADERKNVFLVADLKPSEQRRNSENVEDYGIYPFGVFGLGLPQYGRAKNTFLHRFAQQMWNAWEPACIVAARLGLADEAHRLTVEHCRCNMFANNGAWYSPGGPRVRGTHYQRPVFRLGGGLRPVAQRDGPPIAHRPAADRSRAAGAGNAPLPLRPRGIHGRRRSR